MVTKVEVQSGTGTGIDIHVVKGRPDELSARVNEALKASNKFVTFDVADDKKLGLIAERVEAIWEE